MSAQTQATAQITGHGHTHDGRHCFTVASRTEANRWHVVIVNPSHLECDCQASRYGKVCAHRKVVRERLLAERAEHEAAAAANLVRNTAPLYRDNRPFSIFKQ
jgi:hypothetical protein